MKEESQDYADTFIREIFHTFEGQITEDVVMDWIRVAFTQGIRHGKSFTPGVPTEDGWYTITTNNAVGKPFYETIYFHSGRIISERWGTEPVLSHAKLPEL